MTKANIKKILSLSNTEKEKKKKVISVKHND